MVDAKTDAIDQIVKKRDWLAVERLRLFRLQRAIDAYTRRIDSELQECVEAGLTGRISASAAWRSGAATIRAMARTHGQVQMASPDCLQRVCVVQAGGSQRHLSGRLPNHRRLERSWDDPLDLPRRVEILADAMDQLHNLRHSEGRSLFLGRRRICAHPTARRNRRLYYLQQTDYSTTPCAGAVTTFVQPNGNKITVARSNSGSCAGSEDFFSALIDYRPVKRVDLYAGLMISNVYGGLANGFPTTQDISPTAGIRIRF